MKKILVVSSILVAITATNVHAESGFSEVRRAGVFFTSAIAGAVVAGPVGMIAAAASGVWLDEQVVKAGELELVEASLSTANTRNDQLSQQLSAAENITEQYARMALAQLQLEMLFKTNDSELTPRGEQRLVMLAEFMAVNPDFILRLDGYADPRGDASYNLSLSAARVHSVAQQLFSLGVEERRISIFSHGDSLSQAQNGDYDEYALERIVRIQLSRKDNFNAVAAVTVRRP
jgi:outer membrane protein OmpA-like peptidoglycan-associated protein